MGERPETDFPIMASNDGGYDTGYDGGYDEQRKIPNKFPNKINHLAPQPSCTTPLYNLPKICHNATNGINERTIAKESHTMPQKSPAQAKGKGISLAPRLKFIAILSGVTLLATNLGLSLGQDATASEVTNCLISAGIGSVTTISLLAVASVLMGE